MYLYYVILLRRMVIECPEIKLVKTFMDLLVTEQFSDAARGYIYICIFETAFTIGG